MQLCQCKDNNKTDSANLLSSFAKIKGDSFTPNVRGCASRSNAAEFMFRCAIF